MLVISIVRLTMNDVVRFNSFPMLIFALFGLLSTQEGYHLFLGPPCLSQCWARGTSGTNVG